MRKKDTKTAYNRVVRKTLVRKTFSKQYGEKNLTMKMFVIRIQADIGLLQAKRISNTMDDEQSWSLGKMEVRNKICKFNGTCLFYYQIVFVIV